MGTSKDTPDSRPVRVVARLSLVVSPDLRRRLEERAERERRSLSAQAELLLENALDDSPRQPAAA